jgi:hypothetical protein
MRTASRGYGGKHQSLRQRWVRQVAAGGVCCARCGEPIERVEPWDLGHDDFDRSIDSGPEHRACTARRPPAVVAAFRAAGDTERASWRRAQGDRPATQDLVRLRRQDAGAGECRAANYRAASIPTAL